MTLTADYFDLIHRHNELLVSASRLADVAEAIARAGDDAVPESMRKLTEQDIADAINAVRVATRDVSAVRAIGCDNITT